MKYRAKIYIKHPNMNGLTLITEPCKRKHDAEWILSLIARKVYRATGGHIEQYVDGQGWVVCEEDGE